jgi:hypothetical protein
MKKLFLLSAIVLAACSLNQNSESPSSIIPLPSSEISTTQIPENLTTGELDIGEGKKVSLPSQWSASAGDIDRGARDIDLYKNGVLRGSLHVYDLENWLPANYSNDITDEQENNLRNLFNSLAQEKTLTIELYGLIEENNFGPLLSNNDYIFNISPLLFNTDGLYGFTYLTVAGSHPTILKPIYSAYVYDKANETIVMLKWELDEAEPLLVQRNKKLAEAGDDEMVDALKWLEEYVEGTPRTRLAWGEEFQTADDMMMSYAATTAKTEDEIPSTQGAQLPNDAQIAVPDTWELKPEESTVPGISYIDIIEDKKSVGAISQYNFNAWKPKTSGEEPEYVNEEQAALVKNLVANLYEQGDFTDGLADKIKNSETGTFFSYQPGNIYGLALILCQLHRKQLQ